MLLSLGGYSHGIVKTHLQQVITATAIDLYRLDDWWTETPREHTRQSAFAALAAVA
jgi:hypothetical protein